MKKLTCEMCGSTDLVKQDGMYICQSCSTKYSVEEAKKMMIEGTVEVKGTIKVDDTEKIENYYTMAENAYESNNTSEAENYCNKIIEIEPKYYKAWLLKGRCAGWQSTLSNIRIDESINCFTRAIENSPEAEKENIKKIVSKEVGSLLIAILRLSANRFGSYPTSKNADEVLVNLNRLKLVYLGLLTKHGISAEGFNENAGMIVNKGAVDGWHKVYNDFKSKHEPSKYAVEPLIDGAFSAIELLEKSIDISDEKDISNITLYYENIIFIKEELLKSYYYLYVSGVGNTPLGVLAKESKERVVKEIMEHHNKIKEINPDHEIPEPTKTGGCYVATAVYGSYDCPEVWTLRRYRDYTLAQKWYGRMFIKTYYAISPNLVKWLGDIKSFKKICKTILDHIVVELNSKCVEDTPYEDRNW